MASLQLRSSGPEVAALQQQLQQRGFDPGGINGQFGPATDAAVRVFQQSVGLSADGLAGPNTLAALAMPSVTSKVTLDMVVQMFPGQRHHLLKEGLRHVAVQRAFPTGLMHLVWGSGLLTCIPPTELFGTKVQSEILARSGCY